MAKHKYDSAVAATKKVVKEKLVADTTKKATIKDLAERVADLEIVMNIK
jgi:hypothetical protein